jgi:hypothetical protein
MVSSGMLRHVAPVRTTRLNISEDTILKLVKDKNGDLLADFHNILNRWKNYFSLLFSVHNVSDVRHI